MENNKIREILSAIMPKFIVCKVTDVIHKLRIRKFGEEKLVVLYEHPQKGEETVIDDIKFPIISSKEEIENLVKNYLFKLSKNFHIKKYEDIDIDILPIVLHRERTIRGMLPYVLYFQGDKNQQYLPSIDFKNENYEIVFFDKKNKKKIHFNLPSNYQKEELERNLSHIYNLGYKIRDNDTENALKETQLRNQLEQERLAKEEELKKSKLHLVKFCMGDSNEEFIGNSEEMSNHLIDEEYGLFLGKYLYDLHIGKEVCDYQNFYRYFMVFENEKSFRKNCWDDNGICNENNNDAQYIPWIECDRLVESRKNVKMSVKMNIVYDVITNFELKDTNGNIHKVFRGEIISFKRIGKNISANYKRFDDDHDSDEFYDIEITFDNLLFEIPSFFNDCATYFIENVPISEYYIVKSKKEYKQMKKKVKQDLFWDDIFRIIKLENKSNAQTEKIVDNLRMAYPRLHKNLLKFK